MKKRKICALVVSCAMLFSMLPTSVFAEEGEEDETDAVEITEAEPEEETSDSADIVIGEGGTASLVTEDEEDADTGEDADEAEPEEDAEEEPEEEAEDIVYQAESGSVRVEVTAPADALPEDAKLSVERYAKDSANYRDAAEAIDLDEGSDMAALDISFLVDGEEVEPSEPVQVSIDVSDILPEDADASTLEVQHLVETPDQTIKPVVVANESSATEGTIDEAKATAEFEVDSFSSFTITWGTEGSATEITVYIYDVNGLGIYDSDEQTTYTWEAGTHSIADLLSDHVSGKISDDYTFVYATAQYLNTSNQGGTLYTIGSEDDPVVSVDWDGSTYTVTTQSGTTTSVTKEGTTAAEFYINLYFSTPTVSISVTDADTENHTVSLTANAEHFQNENITYSWEITSGTDYASISEESTENATVTWNDDIEAGTTIIVQVTATSESGETAIASYELEYGMQQVTYTVYYGETSETATTIASGAHVSIMDEGGNIVSSGTTDESGQVTLWVVPGTEYTLEASYTASSGSGIQMSYTHYSYENEKYTYTAESSTNIYLTPSDANFYEHVDVKLSIADPDSEGYSDILANVDYVNIYDESGNLVYQSSSLVHNSGTNDYNVLFADADGNVGDNPHSIAFYDTYTIEIGYEVSYSYEENGEIKEYTESYVATIDKNSTYVEDEYYSYSGTNAYQLYNELYGTDYDADSFADAVAASAAGEEGGLEYYNEHGIALEGLSYFVVAAALCDTKDTANQAGLDLALGINSLKRYSSTTWNFDIQKTFENSAMTDGQFTFDLYEASYNNDDGLWYVDVSANDEEGGTNGYVLTVTGDAAELEDGKSISIMSDNYTFSVDSSMAGNTTSYYFILYENKGDDANVSYDDTVYGIKLDVTLNDASDLTKVTIDETYYKLTSVESGSEGYNAYEVSDSDFELDDDADGFTIYPFENTYKLAEAEIEVQKVLEGRGWLNDDSFEFTISTDDEDTPLPEETTLTITAEDAPDFTKAFESINYEAEGEYTYTITETEGSIKGIEYDANEITVTVTVSTDEDTGEMVVSVKYGDNDEATAAVFTNEYTPDDSKDVVDEENNSINEQSVQVGDTLTYVIDWENTAADEDGLAAAATVTITDEIPAGTVYVAGSATSDVEGTTIRYYVEGSDNPQTTEPDDASTVTKIEWVISADAGATGEVSFAVTVTEGALEIENQTVVNSAEITVGNDSAIEVGPVTNPVDSAEAIIEVQKVLSGHGWEDDYEFTFTLKDSDENVVDTITITKGDAASSFKKAFESITYTKPGVYIYTITETEGSIEGLEYDSSEIAVTVTVSEDDEGGLSTTVSYGNDGADAAVFTNTYTEYKDQKDVVDSEGNSMNGDTVLVGDTLTYVIDWENDAADESGMPAAATVTITDEIPEGTIYVAGSAESDAADTTIQYYVGGNDEPLTEEPDDASTVTKIVWVISAEADGTGTVSFQVTVTEGALELEDQTVVNSATIQTDNDSEIVVGPVSNPVPSTEAKIQVQKILDGRDWKTDDTFTFTISAGEGTPMPGETELTITADDATDYTKSFDSITFTNPGDYTYIVTETEGDISGIEYDSTDISVTVNVTQNDDGSLSATVSYREGDTAAVFTNTYSAGPTDVQFAGTKYITNSDSTEKVFTFELYATSADFDITGLTPEEVSTEGEITSPDGQNYAFNKIEYTEAGTYYYVIQEKALDTAEGWTIDSTVYNITVVVEDNGEGQLVATVTVDGTEVSETDDDVYGGFDFTNEYAAEGSVTLGVVKSISGVASTEEEFEFTLYDSDSSFSSTGSEIETITTDGTIPYSQAVNFEEIGYLAAGEYYYIIRETGTAPDGWTLDEKEYHVTVTVTDNGDGTLTTEASYDYDGSEESENSANFTNKYEATGSLILTGSKTLEGGTLAENGFTFTMTDSNGASVGDVSMDADGNITFPILTYDETDIGGEYTYTIAEVNTEDSSVQCDDTTYTVVVSVADNGDGTLSVTYTVNDEENGDITFTNYQKGSLTISKSFTGLTEDQIADLENFTITVKNSNGEEVATLTLDDADAGSSYTWTVSDLVADTYTVTESGYSLDGYEVIAKSGEVEVTNGSDVSVDDSLAWGGEDTVAFTNDYTEVGTITVSKYVTAEEDIQKTHAGTEYTVVITAKDEDVNFQWVTITTDNSEHYIVSSIEGNTITFTITENETVTISGLPTGKYTVEEQGSDAMTSEHCIPSYRVGDETTEEAPTVTVASGEENVVAVEIDNEYPIGTYIQVKKDYNKDEYPTGDDAFTFTIEALSADLDAGDTLSASEMPMPTNSTVTVTESDGGYIGLITFDDEENEFEHFGTYYYKITETKGSLDNVDYDESVHYVKIVVGYDDFTHVLTTDEWEAKADAETDDYKNLAYTEAGIVTAEFTNTAYDELTLEKEVSGNAGDTSEYVFEITLTKDGTGYTGDIETTDDAASPLAAVKEWFSGIVKMLAGDDSSIIEFTDGVGTVTVKAGESITLLIPSGWNCTVTEKTTGADTTTVYKDGEVIVQAKGTTTEATAELGTIADSTQVKFVNSYRAYYPIDEEIVTDTDDIFDRDAWVKDEAVNEYNAIEIEMTTNLPTVTAYDLENGDFTMNFHNVLDHELVLDENTTDFSVYIGEVAISAAYYKVTFDDDTGDDCNFHVDVDLTALYNDGIVTEDMLDGNTEITIFFFADLEGTDLNGSYTSTIWYDIYDGDEWLYTSNKSVVEVYTYEIEIIKYDISDDSEKLSGATFGVYYDEECKEPVSRNGEDYTAVSDKDGVVMFYGLADGTYYVKELKAPAGYVLSDEVIKAELGEDLKDGDYTYHTTFANTPEEPHDDEEPWKAVDTDGDGNFNDDGVKVNVGDKITYAINYYNNHDDAETVVITDTLDYALDFVSATDDGKYDADTRTITWTIKDAEPGWGYVYFTATVNDIALVEEEIENTASVKVGNDAAQDTNMVANPTPDSSEAGSGTPKTGDDSHPLAWTLLLLASLLAMGTAFAMKKQSRRKVRNRK